MNRISQLLISSSKLFANFKYATEWRHISQIYRLQAFRPYHEIIKYLL